MLLLLLPPSARHRRRRWHATTAAPAAPAQVHEDDGSVAAPHGAPVPLSFNDLLGPVGSGERAAQA